MKAVAEAWTTRPAGIHGVIADQAPVSARGVTPHFQAVHGTPAADMVFDLQQAPGCRPRSRMPKHSHSIGEWNPPIRVRPSSRMAVTASKVFRITPPGHWDEQRKPVLSLSRKCTGPAAHSVGDTQCPFG